MINVPLSLLVQCRVMADRPEGAVEGGEVSDHHLTEAILRVHLLVRDKRSVQELTRKADQL